MNEDELLKMIIFILLGYFAAKYLRLEGFTPDEVLNTALADINKAGCCVSNTAGYGVNPIPVSEAAPGYSTIGPYSNPCGPQ